MEIKALAELFSVCKVVDATQVDLNKNFCFAAKTDEELSLVCPTKDVPAVTSARDDGWKGFRIQGTLDFSLIGILAKITAILAEQKIGVFAISTFNTDYILVKQDNFAKALQALAEHGYNVLSEEAGAEQAAPKQGLPSENALYKLLRPELEAALKGFGARQHSAKVTKYISGFLRALDSFAKGKELKQVHAFAIVQELEDNNYTQLNFYLDSTTLDVDCCGFVEQDGLMVNSYNNWELSIDGAACESPDVFDYDMVNELVEILAGDKVRLEVELPDITLLEPLA